MPLNSGILSLDITSNDFTGITKIFQGLELKVDQLQQQVDILQSALEREKTKRVKFEKRLRNRLTKLLDLVNSTSDNEQYEDELLQGNADDNNHTIDSNLAFESHLTDFNSVFNGNENNINSSDAISHKPRSNDEKISGECVNGIKGPSADIKDNIRNRNGETERILDSCISINSNSQLKSVNARHLNHEDDMLITRNVNSIEIPLTPSSHLNCDLISNNEDLPTFINEVLSVSNKKRTLSNEFSQSTLLPQQFKKIQCGLNCETPFPKIPIIPLNNPSRKREKPSQISMALNFDEIYIKEKYGIEFSEKYSKISDLWNEYIKIGEKGISIKLLEETNGNKWRSNLNKSVKKKYNRRLIIARAIENGIRRGKNVEESILILENFLKDNNKAVSHFYTKLNLPKELL